MKIRHKQSGVVLEGAFEERAYWVGSNRHEYFGLVPESSTYDKKEWEEVKPEWKDVTSECTFEGSALVYWPIKKNPPNLMVSEVDGFRLRRVPHDTLRIRREHETPADCITKGYAFIIEQRQA